MVDQPSATRERDALVSHTGALIARLQSSAIENRAWAVGALARMRRAPLDNPAYDPSIYQVIFDQFPKRYQRGELPTPEERGAYVAACLFAIHQQSKSEHMHRTAGEGTARYGLGTAVRRLAQSDTGVDPASATTRRFNALVTADNSAEIVHHLRSLIGLLRGAGLALDYGRLARDLADLVSEDTSRHQRVQLRWAREFSRSASSSTPVSAPSIEK